MEQMPRILIMLLSVVQVMYNFVRCLFVYIVLRCFNAVGWAAGRASGP